MVFAYLPLLRPFLVRASRTRLISCTRSSGRQGLVTNASHPAFLAPSEIPASACLVVLVLHRGPCNGSVKVNVEPFRTWLVTSSRPFNICARRRQIDRPRPVPPYARVGELSS